MTPAPRPRLPVRPSSTIRISIARSVGLAQMKRGRPSAPPRARARSAPPATRNGSAASWRPTPGTSARRSPAPTTRRCAWRPRRRGSAPARTPAPSRSAAASCAWFRRSALTSDGSAATYATRKRFAERATQERGHREQPERRPVQQPVHRHQRVDDCAPDVARDHQAPAIEAVDQRAGEQAGADLREHPERARRPICATEPVDSSTSSGRATRRTRRPSPRGSAPPGQSETAGSRSPSEPRKCAAPVGDGAGHSARHFAGASSGPSASSSVRMSSACSSSTPRIDSSIRRDVGSLSPM